MNAPTLMTDHLILRPHLAEDFTPFAEMLASDRAEHMGGPYDRDGAWGLFTSDVAQWNLMGWGGLAVTDRQTAEVYGQVSIIQPPRWPEPEIGWMAFPNGEGKGLMTEAARALRDWAFGPRGLSTLVSYIDPPNNRSIAVAERLGGTLDAAAVRPDPEDLVYRYASRKDE